MEEILDLSPDVQRPLIKLNDIFKGCTALIDTGALIPIWTKDVSVLEDLGAELVRKNVEFGGFGGIAKGDFYRLDFKLGRFMYPGMPIVASQNEDIPGFFLLSATMFTNMDYSIKNSSKKFMLSTSSNQVCYNLKVEFDGDYIVLCQVSEMV